MSENLMLDVDQAGELKAAFRRTRGSDGSKWTNGAIKKLSEGNTLGQVLDIIESRSVIVPVEKKKTESLLELVGTITILATTGKFVVRDRFVVNTKRNAPVKISYVGNNFTEWFLGKVEEAMTETELCYAKLIKTSVDGPILAELGEKAETRLSHMYALMEKQGNGESGVLLTDGRANIFYIKDVNEVLCAVRVFWRVDGWRVNADSVENPLRWLAGYWVFSRNSCRTL